MTNRSTRSRLSILLAFMGSVAGAIAAPPTLDDDEKTIGPILKQYCFECHANGAKEGSVAFDQFATPTARREDRKLWLAVWRNLQSELMPPAEHPRPTGEQRRQMFDWIEQAVFQLDPKNPDPGRVTIRRLNREEYRYTILDLLGIEFETNEMFPADDTGYGFDTIGDVLNLSPILMEKYLEAAELIVDRYLDRIKQRVPTAAIGPEQFKGPGGQPSNAKWLPFAESVMVEQRRDMPIAGKYRITAELKVAGSDEATQHSANLAVLINDQVIAKKHLGWDLRKSIALSATIDLPKGPARLGLSLTEDDKPLDGEGSLALVLQRITITGPLDVKHLEPPKEYYRVFADGPPSSTQTQDRVTYARKILKQLADRAYRRPNDDASLEQLTALAAQSIEPSGMTFEKAIGQAMIAILASPRFLFRAETQPEPNNPGRIVPLDEFALASRLSYLLWSSLPDQQLFDLAQQGKLRAQLHAEVDRLLADPKSERFIDGFVGQWLQTRDVTSVNINASRILGIRNSEVGKRFGMELRRSMGEETEQLFAHLLRENKSVLELFTADYSFLNERLAQFYGIDGVKGREYRQAPLPANSHRRGILTHASLLVVTSNPTRTSPVKRGLFVLENLLGTPAPPPPPDVPLLEDAKKEGNRPATMREAMVIHREKALCASCHARMDPIGLGLENFNALGQWRDRENGAVIQPEGQLITGEKFTTVEELAQIFATSRRMDFYRCLVAKLLTYAIGRGPEYYDAPTITRLAENLDAHGGQLKSLLHDLVESAPFQKRRGDGEPMTP